MRLLTWNGRDEFHLTDFNDDIPAYAILSHTWGPDEDEVTFTDVQTCQGKNKVGQEKIRFCGERARRDGLKYFWVDTCCIDKSSHAELSEAINSMFHWYRNAEKCYVYLSDVFSKSSSNHIVNPEWYSSFRASQWFTRGWTLQELLAPQSVEFFSHEGVFLGTKQTLIQQIHEITHIPLSALQGTPLSQFSVDERLQWSKWRRTREEEDTAYCLLGIFNVFMPIIYGEGSNRALRRLLKEIDSRAKHPDDASKFRPLGLYLMSAPLIDPANFIGRATELERMAQILQPGKLSTEQRRLVLGGIGGVGKTQLAIAYAQRYQHSYTSVFWLNAASELTLKADMRRIAQQIDTISVLEGLKDEQITQAVTRWLSDFRNTDWLLIFDNYDEPEAYDIHDYYPHILNGSIIVTTRLPDFISGLQQLRVRPIEHLDDGLEILQVRSQRVNAKYDIHARRLAERLGGLPLALATAGAFLRKSTMTFEQYLTAYEQRFNVDFRRPIQLREYSDRTLHTTWNLSYQRLQLSDAVAAETLKLLAYFDNQDIWFELFYAGLRDNSPTWLQELAGNQIDFENVMTLLVEYGFLEVHAAVQSYSMHNCVHDWTLAELNRTIDPQMYWYSVDCVSNNLDEADWKGLAQLQYARLSQHGARLSHPRFDSVTEIDLFLQEAAKQDSWIQVSWIARLLQQQVQLPAAERLYKRALAGQENLHGSDHISTLHIVNDLATLFTDQGKLNQAEQMYERALSGKETGLGPNHDSVLETVNNIALLYIHQNKLNKAEQMLQRALAGQEQIFGPDHPSTLHTVHNFGTLYLAQGKLEEAELMFLRALAGRERTLGRTNVLTLETVNDVGLLYVYQGRLNEAEQMLLRTLAEREKVLGHDHTSTLDTVENLGVLYVDQGKLDEAEQMYLRALTGKEGALGVDHISTLDTASSLGVLYRAQAKFDEAEQMLLRALAGQEKALVSDHISILTTMNNIGLLYVDQDKLDEAEQMYQKALLGYDTTLHSDTIPALNVVNNLGGLYTRQGKRLEAEQMYNRALAGRRRILGSEHPSTLSTIQDLESLLQRGGGDQEILDDSVSVMSTLIGSLQSDPVLAEAARNELRRLFIQDQFSKSILQAICFFSTLDQTRLTSVLANVLRKFARDLQREVNATRGSSIREACKFLSGNATRVAYSITNITYEGSEPSQNVFTSLQGQSSDAGRERLLNDYLTSSSSSMSKGGSHSEVLPMENRTKPSVVLSPNSSRSSSEAEEADGSSIPVLETLRHIFRQSSSYIQMKKSLLQFTQEYMYDWPTIEFEWREQQNEPAPLELRDASTEDILILQEETLTLTDRIKIHLETHSGQPWDWWPLQPPRKPISTGNVRLRWTCYCGHSCSADITQSLAEKIKKFTCTAHIHRKSMQLHDPDENDLLRVDADAYIRAQLPRSPPFQTQHDSVASSAINKMSGGSAGQIPPYQSTTGQPTTGQTNTGQTNTGQTNTGQTNTGQTNTGATWMLICAKNGSALRHEQIEIKSNMNDNDFFKDFRNEYRKLRGWSYWYHPNKFYYCHAAKFVKWDVRQLGYDCNQMPDSVSYTFQPRPPRRPYERPVPVREWEHRFHKDCSYSSRDFLSCLPKKIFRHELDTCMGREDLWGLYVMYRTSAKAVLIWLFIFVSPCLGFLVHTLVRGQKLDLQTASVPITITLTAMTTFYVLLGSQFKGEVEGN